ncbi:hypothetical protein H1Q59_02590 [Holosporaceae bacterium 'Namur']|nr:hypothetical protein [Holosporaceae bacterium 'Namur']
MKQSSSLMRVLSELGFNGWDKYDVDYSYKNGNPPKVVETYSAQVQQEAFIKNMYISGLFSKENIWESINIMGGFEDPVSIFNSICTHLSDAGAFQPDLEKFKAAEILKNLFSESVFDNQDIQDFILYWTQTAFNRKVNQERASLATMYWMQDNDLKKDYFENARIMGLVAAKVPLAESYDETWVLGSAALPLIWKMDNLKNTKELKGINPGFERFLTGKRELSNMGVLESPDFIKKVADFIGVKYIGEPNSFIKRPDDKQYLNYAEGETKKVYESDLVRYIYQDCFNKTLDEQNLIDVAAREGTARPDTGDTIKAALNKLIQEAEEKEEFKKGKEITILITSIQPHIERQRIGAQRIIDNELKSKGFAHIKISTHSLAPELNEQVALANISILHSDMATLISEQYLKITEGKEAKRDAGHLMFQSRQQYLKENLPPMPEPILLGEMVREEFPLEIALKEVGSHLSL